MLIHAGLGLLIGVILALTGAGGGILAVPLLIFGAHQRVAEAGPVGLLAVGMAAALGAALGLRTGIVRYRAAFLISATGMALSPMGLWLAHRVDNRWLTMLFAAVLLFVAYRTFRQAGIQPGGNLHANKQSPPCIRDADSGRFIWTTRCARAGSVGQRCRTAVRTARRGRRFCDGSGAEALYGSGDAIGGCHFTGGDRTGICDRRCIQRRRRQPELVRRRAVFRRRAGRDGWRAAYFRAAGGAAAAKGLRRSISAGGNRHDRQSHDVKRALQHRHCSRQEITMNMLPIQSFDPESSTFTYILCGPGSSDAVIIDPVDRQWQRDLQQLERLNLRLVYVLETHAHADHVTSARRLCQLTGAKAAAPSGCGIAPANVQLEDGDTLRFGDSEEIRVLHTPGHTAGSMSFIWRGNAFTGDTLLIDGCGRTDFQGGSAPALYDSVTQKLFTLPDTTLVWPAHDYKGRSASTIGWERRNNSRLADRSKDSFIELMNNLNLPKPKLLDIAVPANRNLGLPHGG